MPDGKTMFRSFKDTFFDFCVYKDKKFIVSFGE